MTVDTELEDLDNELDEELDDDGEDHDQDEVERIKQENERLRKQNEKLKLKKHKAIEKSGKQAIYTEDLERFFKEKKEQENFERDYPGVDYDVVVAVAEKKGVSKEEALSFLGNTGRTMLGREVTQPRPKTDAELEARKKALGLI